MIAARRAVQRPGDAKLLAVSARGELTHRPRRDLPSLLARGDLVVANDAATIPASLAGVHLRTGRAIEARLAQRRSLDSRDVLRFTAVLFGEGDWRTRTEDRRAAPRVAIGDTLQLGSLRAIVEGVGANPRVVELRFEGEPAAVWRALAEHGRPIQYAYLEAPLAMWDVWTPIAAVPAAFEPPSAGFALDWRMLDELRARGVEFATLTHAAGISSTGDADLDRMLPFDEPYRIPEATAQAIARARRRNGRVIAVGTTVVRALESAAADHGRVRAGEGVATLRIGPETPLRAVDAVLSGTHEPGTSHYRLLGAFTDAGTLARADRELEARGYRTHEFGDSVWIVRSSRRAP